MVDSIAIARSVTEIETMGDTGDVTIAMKKKLKTCLDKNQGWRHVLITADIHNGNTSGGLLVEIDPLDIARALPIVNPSSNVH